MIGCSGHVVARPGGVRPAHDPCSTLGAERADREALTGSSHGRVPQGPCGMQDERGRTPAREGDSGTRGDLALHVEASQEQMVDIALRRLRAGSLIDLAAAVAVN